MERRKIACAAGRIETSGSTARESGRRQASVSAVPGVVEHEESDMMSEIQVHVIARQMFEKHGLEAIVQAAPECPSLREQGRHRRSQRVAPHRRRHEDDAGTASKLTGLQCSSMNTSGRPGVRAITLRRVRWRNQDLKRRAYARARTLARVRGVAGSCGMSGSRFYTTKTQSGNWVPLFDHFNGIHDQIQKYLLQLASIGPQLWESIAQISCDQYSVLP